MHEFGRGRILIGGKLREARVGDRLLTTSGHGPLITQLEFLPTAVRTGPTHGLLLAERGYAWMATSL